MKQFFQDSSSRLSMMRLLSFITVISGIACAFFMQDIALTSVLIGFGFGGKVAQKFQK